MQFIDLSAQQLRIRDQIDERIRQVLNHGQYIMGPEMFELEKSLAEFAGVKHALSCSSGTDALLMALMALGVGPGHAVFTTPFTFVATAEVVALIGATPVFVDIRPDTFNMDIERLRQKIAEFKKPGKLLADAPVVTPAIPDGSVSVWAQYSILARDAAHRDKIRGKLQEAKFPTAVYYPKPLHLQKAFEHLGGTHGDFPVCEDCAERIFSLPMHPYLEIDDQKAIAEIVARC